MSKRVQKKPETLQRECDNWNGKYPIGTLVEYYPVRGVDRWETHTTASAASVMSGHTAVIFLTGKAGCVALDHCKAYPPVPEFKKLIEGQS